MVGDAGAVGGTALVDVTPETWTIDPALVEAAITPRTRAIMPVHLGHQMADMDRIMEIARSHSLAVVEDCAHAHASEWRGKRVGTFGVGGTFSFQSSKIMTAGEGGIVITSRLDAFELVQSIVNCGRASATDQYKKRGIGSNYRITEFQAAILLGQLEQLPVDVGPRGRHRAWQ